MYLVIMPNSWGKGASISEAEKIARREGRHGRKKVVRVAYKFDKEKTPDCYVNEWGCLCWTGERPEKLDL